MGRGNMRPSLSYTNPRNDKEYEFLDYYYFDPNLSEEDIKYYWIESCKDNNPDEPIPNEVPDYFRWEQDDFNFECIKDNIKYYLKDKGWDIRSDSGYSKEVMSKNLGGAISYRGTKFTFLAENSIATVGILSDEDQRCLAILPRAGDIVGTLEYDEWSNSLSLYVAWMSRSGDKLLKKLADIAGLELSVPTSTYTSNKVYKPGQDQAASI